MMEKRNSHPRKGALPMLDEARLTLLKQMAHGLAAEFGPSCEVVIHDRCV